MDSVRLDKWLWSVRIFKTRSKAATACRENKVKIEDKAAKASTLLKGGELIVVNKDGFRYQYEVIKLIEKRVGAPLAVECYKNLTPEEEMRKYDDWFVGKGRPEIRERGAGRPTKKDRRNLMGFKEDED